MSLPSPRSAARAGRVDADLATSFVEILTVAIQELIEAELTASSAPSHGERHRDANEPTQRAPPQAGVDAGGGSRVEDPQAPIRVVLPGAAGTAPADRQGVVGGDHDRLHHRHLDPEGRRPRQGVGLRQRRSRSRTVSRICKQIDTDVAVLRNRRLDHQPFVYMWLDATYVHVRDGGQVVSKAVVIATGLRADGHREVLGVDVGDSENETFWTEFLRDLKDRGLDGVRLVISDAHAGLKAAIRRVLQGVGMATMPRARHAQPACRSPITSTARSSPR